MKSHEKILLAAALLSLLLTAGWYVWRERALEDARSVSITTDRGDYTEGERILVTIRNTGTRPVDISCPSWCALGNFPTTVERLAGGEWQYFAGFCPGIEPLFGSGTPDGDYIRHTLAQGATFDLALSNLGALRLEKEETVRIMYYAGATRVPVYSNTFRIRP